MLNQTVFVLDTSTLLYNSNSTKSFEEHEVVIPYVVLEELDKFKSRDDVVGSNARQVARQLNDLRKQGPIDEGVVVNIKGGKLRVELNHYDSNSPHLDTSKNDDRILNVCLGIKSSGHNVTLVTKDVNLAVRADVLGIGAQDFDSDKTVNSIDDMYMGSAVLSVNGSLIDDFYSGSSIGAEELEVDLYPNQYVTLVSMADAGKTALARFDGPSGELKKINTPDSVWGIKPRNREQRFSIDAVFNPNIPLVSFTGMAGTGKTIISLACALHLVQDTGIYDRLIVSRPVQPMGRDIGYLPGSVDEKLSPWMGPIKDSLEFLTRGKSTKGRDMYQEMISLRMLEVEPLTYIRGRSLPNTIFIVDESQDLSRAEIKTIVSRMGENSKLVLIGDVMQISNPYLDSFNSGLSNVVEKFKDSPHSAHITLIRGERSKLATIASEIL